LYKSRKLYFTLSSRFRVEKVNNKIAIFNANYVGDERSYTTQARIVVEVARASRLE
jgi:hypothetical protein